MGVMNMANASIVLGIATLLSAIGGGMYVLMRGRRTPDVRRHLVPTCTPMLAFVAAATCFIGVMKGQYSDWDAARLAISLAVTKGHAVYSTLTTGSIQTTMYPPGWILAYLPASLGHTPTSVMGIGYILAQVFTLAPMAALCLLIAHRRSYALAVFTAFLYFAVRTDILGFACFLPHADAPALGFALTATLLLHRALASEQRATPMLWLSAFFACWSVWSKQTMLPIAPALLVAAAIRGGRRHVTQLFIAMAVLGLSSLAIALLIFPFDGMFLNLITMPSRHPWKGNTPFNLFAVALELAHRAVVPILFLGVGAAVARLTRTKEAQPTTLWPFLIFVGACMLPLSLLGRVKVGGAASALSPALYFVYAAVAAIFLETMARCETTEASPGVRSACQGLAFVLALAVGGTALLQSLQEIRFGFRSPRLNHSEEAFAFLTNSAQHAYFPAYPLAHLMAEGKLYHFAQAIADREHDAGIPITATHRAAYFPSDPELVCWSKRLYGTERMRIPGYFTNYTERVNIPQLPSFRCYAQPR